MLCHHIRVERSRILTDLDLEIAPGVTGIERAQEGKKRIKVGLTSGQFREIEAELFAGWPEIQNATFG